MKKASVVIVTIAILFLFVATSPAATYDASGQWVVTTSNYWVDQGNSGDCEGGSNDTINVTIDQEGDSFTLTMRGRKYQGSISGSSYSGGISYAEEGGTTEEHVSVSLQSESYGFGYGEWEWHDRYYYCSGGYDITIGKSSVPYDGIDSGSGGDSSGSGGGGDSGGCFIDTFFRMLKVAK